MAELGDLLGKTMASVENSGDELKDCPGPWKIEARTGRDSFIVYRLSHWNTGWREYLTARDGVSSRPSRFKSEAAARAAIAKATGGAT